MTSITEPGLFEIDAQTYHADPCPAPSLSNSLIKVLLDCPRRAWQAHPRLNPRFQPQEATRLDLGTVTHEILLGTGRGYQVVEFADYRTKDAQAARDAVRAAGKTPVLPHQLEAANSMAVAALEQLKGWDGAEAILDRLGTPELGLFWRDGPIWCRSLVDWLRNDQPVWEVWDYKTTETDINPENAALGIHVVSMGYDTQVALQERGLLALFPALAGRIKFRWLFQSTEEPYLISVVEPDAATMTMARKKVEYAIGRWSACLASGQWPAYPRRIVPLRHADHLAARWLEREMREHDAGGLPAAAPPKVKPKRGRPKKSQPLDSLMGG